ELPPAQQQPAAEQPPSLALALVPQPQAQAQIKPTRVSLSYEEISKLFSLPIAEAASILGVCTSVLKRICRTHGIVRWPYRKIVSGKGDDAKNAEREKAMQLLELSKIAKQKGVPKAQQGSAKAGSAIGRQNAPSLSQFSQAKDIPTYMDDFKYGFPSSGLSTETMKWWGTDSHTETAPAKDDNREGSESTNEASKGMTDDELDWGADEPEADADGVAAATDPSAQLCFLRRKAAGDGRRLLNGDTGRVQQLCRLNKRQKIVLAQVFGASLPEQWRSKLA
uniref:RWP-RK domain-containing protein n=1 Tax=Aegilops tauschii subsp. strangulata TaxID=200361 RepID=A0A453EL90_AEGTS